MTRRRPLPLSDEWTDADSYVESLLTFATSSELFKNLCGGVHILDFLTRDPELYSSLLPEDWRNFFEEHDVQDILDLLLREDVQFLRHKQLQDEQKQWRGGPPPPQSLLDYIIGIRRLSLRRDFKPVEIEKPTKTKTKGMTIPKRLAVGMKPKKRHEVENFSRYVDSLSANVADSRGESVSHIVDFGSGQNYLGRTLASPPYNKHIIAIEQRHQFINGARGMDVLAQLAEKEAAVTKRQALRKRKQLMSLMDAPQQAQVEKVEKEGDKEKENEEPPSLGQFKDTAKEEESPTNGNNEEEDDESSMINVFRGIDLEPNELAASVSNDRKKPMDEEPKMEGGAIDYIEHEIQDGHLEPIIEHVVNSETAQKQAIEKLSAHDSSAKPTDARVMVVSLHSCGNLLHHGVRSLVLNPSVVAVAMVGCCYNLMTERLGPATFKLPALRSLHPRLVKTSVEYDPHGFPMSKRFEKFPHAGGTGIKLNITARTMAVQAPSNWGREDSEGFFTRHFYRALLQRILLDKEIVPKPSAPSSPCEIDPDSSGGTALVVGSLRKTAFVSFPAYVRAAVQKLIRLPEYGEKIKERIVDISDEELNWYEAKYWPTKRRLSVAWSLMAFSAAVSEAIIVVDRWQFLREHDHIKTCWVEPVFDYGESPRNLAVVGIKD